jgi:anthraniloyl-CoA monooxygenase
VKIAVLGGGPAGLYFALLMKKADPSREIELFERNPPDATFGWGVVFSEETLGSFRDADFDTYTEITDTFARWGAIDVRYRGETVRSRGHVFFAIARKRLLAILQARCRDLGVDLHFEHEVGDLGSLEGHDLIVAADGVNSTARPVFADQLRPSLDVHPTKFAWFGTDLVFDAFTFIFRENEHGLFQVHAYPFDGTTSTFIVECPEEVWRRAGLDQASEEESMAYCERLFAEELDGHRLMSNRSVWISFVTLRLDSWHAGNVVLLGDAAHTAHFTIGSGTKLAMEDAISLAAALTRHRDLKTALLEYELDRQPVVERFQEAARDSATYFENVRRYREFHPLQFAFNLLTRSGRITHLELEKRDPVFLARVDGWFARDAHGEEPTGDRGISIAPPPLFAPLRLRMIDMSNRVAVSVRSQDDARDGLPSDSSVDRIRQAAARGAGMVQTEFIAVSAHGRITPGTPGLYAADHRTAWRRIVDEAHHAGTKVAALIGHAGPRGATRPRREGVDRPLRDGDWPLLAASLIPFTPFSQTPNELSPEKMAEVVGDFVSAARAAAEAGFDMLQLHAAQGYLMASFLSPLLNRRLDEYGGALEARMRFPVEILRAVREAWPEDRPLGVTLLATDWVAGGFDLDDAVEVAGALRASGCDFVEPLAGQTSQRAIPNYGRFYLVPASDRIRNEARVPTIVGGNLTTADEANTILAAGRADLCVLDLERAV